jgi:signal transduction histidine kinase
MAHAARRHDLGAFGQWAFAPERAPLAALTAGALVAGVAEIGGRGLPQGPPGLLVVVFTVVAIAPMAAARDRPAVAAGVTAGAALLVASYRPLPWAVVVAVGVTAFFLARSRPWYAVAVVAAYALVAVALAGTDREQSTVIAAAVAGAATALGAALRWRERAAWLTATAHDAQRTLLENVTLEERSRIARELHDVVAHHISMIAVQAEAARLLVPDLAPDGERRLVEIGDTARAALTEMRRLLGVLREEAPTAAPARSPQPGLQQLDALVDEVRAVTGATMRLIVHGPVVPLDPGVELTAYRIVQEALTNARRHAAGAAVDIELDYRPDALHVRVRDNGLGLTTASDTTPGHGLDGMRERTAMLGGRITTGPLADGGFAIAAVLPGAAEP